MSDLESRVYSKTYHEVLRKGSDEYDNFNDGLEAGGFHGLPDDSLLKDEDGIYYEYSELVDELFSEGFFTKDVK